MMVAEEFLLVNCYVAFSQETTPLCLLYYLSFCRLLAYLLSPVRLRRFFSALPVASSPSIAVRNRFVVFSKEMTPLHLPLC
jgi:hypothetical protein